MFQDVADMAVVVSDRLGPLGNLDLSFVVCRIACLVDLRQDELKSVGIRCSVWSAFFSRVKSDLFVVFCVVVVR